MKIKINKEVISALNPCKERFDNYLESYNNFNGDIQEFLDLANISHSDKLWVAFRVIPRSILEVFSIDCAFSAYAAYAAAAYADVAYANYANNDAANAANAAAKAADVPADTAYAAADAADAAYVAAAKAAAYAATGEDAAYAAADAADAAYVAARKKEQENQIAILKYLISEEK